jgi:hypothetical protein
MGPKSDGAHPDAFGPVQHILTHRKMTAWFKVEDAPDAKRGHGRWVNVEQGDANWPRIIDKVLPELRSWIVKN